MCIKKSEMFSYKNYNRPLKSTLKPPKKQFSALKTGIKEEEKQ